MIYSICLFSVLPVIYATGRATKITGKYWRNSTRAFEAITDFLTSEELGLGLFEFLFHFKRVVEISRIIKNITSFILQFQQ